MCLGAAGRIVRFDDPDRLTATVDLDGVHTVVDTGMLAAGGDAPAPGDWVLVHLGIALQRMEPDEVEHVRSSYDELMADFETLAAARDAAGRSDPSAG